MQSCLFLDDELNLLPVSSQSELIEATAVETAVATELEKLVT
jgi:hypothetical protein